MNRTSEPPTRRFPKRRAMFALVLAGSAVLSVWLIGMIVGAFPRSHAIWEGFALILTPLVIFFGITAFLRLSRPGAYLVLDREGFTLDGLFDHERCSWLAVTRIEPSEAHGHGQVEIDLGTDPEQTFLVNANWLRMPAARAADLLTRYWRHAKFGEPFEATA